MDEDEEDEHKCERCGLVVEEEDLDDEGICSACNEAAEYDRQRWGDFNAMTR